MNSREQDLTRRDFLCRMSMMGAAVMMATALPLAGRANPLLSAWQSDAGGAFAGQDEALGNYPHYAEAIGFGRGHLQDDTGADPLELL